MRKWMEAKLTVVRRVRQKMNKAVENILSNGQSWPKCVLKIPPSSLIPFFWTEKIWIHQLRI